ncbi:MAG TPA: excinuclease ABC subunit UvrC [Bacteroidia bacterium]|nr:excinuclease ABC subunit UvrC [Bacteroidia bacterium]
MLQEEQLSAIIKSLPDKPGIYQYFDENGVIIYVGKAKVLKKRVTSYFNRDNQLDRKTQALVKNIADIKFIIVETELDALLLENNLIKKYQPKYNVLLKDGRTYPCIVIKNEEFPRVFPTRQIIKDGSNYFGPFASVKMMYTMLDLIKENYQLRNCNFNLSNKNINARKFKVCLEYHIGNCKGPCEGKQSNEEYEKNISEIKQIVKGNIYGIIKQLKTKMQLHAEHFEYEKAHQIKLRIDSLENYQSKSAIVSASINNVDVVSILSDVDFAYVNYLKVVNGSVVQGHTIELKKKLNESDEELLLIGFAELRGRFGSDSNEVIVPFELDLKAEGIEFIVPQRGDKRKLLDLSLKNVEYYKRDKQKQQELVDPERHTKRILTQMMKDLRLTLEPRHIECFDNSNIQGAFPVAAMTVFKELKPSKKDYRHFNIKTVEGPNDFASMEEIIYRRYKRLLEEEQPIPDLIVIDGGKGQLGAALQSLEKLNLRGKVAIVGIAKKLEEIYYPGDSLPLYLDKKGETLKVLQHIRDEAHRFGITHHRNKRSKGTIKTELTNIKGISEQSAGKLLSHFKSVKIISQSSLSEIESVLGKSKAQLVVAYFIDKNK